MAHVVDVTIDNTQVDADLTDFVVYIDLSDLPTTEFWGTVANGGGDIRCYKSDGTTQLAREVVSCDTATDTGELHVKFTGTLSSTVDTVIQIWTDEGTEPAVAATYGRNSVWSDYEFVWHGEDGLTDSSGNHTLEAVGSPTTSIAAGVIGSGGSQLSAAKHYRTTTTTTLTSPFTLQGWTECSNNNGSRAIAIGDSSSTSANTQTHLRSAPNFHQFDYRNNEANSASGTSATVMLHGVENGANSLRTLYGNGASIATNSTASATPVGFFDRISVGASADSTAFGWFADIDESRVRYSELSADWISTEYNNQSAPATFYTATAASAAGYSLSLASGSLSLTGGVLDATASRRISLEGGTLSTTGGELTFATGRTLFLDSGDYDLTGGDQLHLVGRSLALSVGDFTLTGGVLGLTTAAALTLEAGSFTLTGGQVDFSYSASLDLAAGSYSLSGGELEALQLADAEYENVSASFHFDAADGTTTIVDDGPDGITTAAVNGGTEISTDDAKFGPSSLYVDGGTSSCLKIPGLFNPNADDWTIEFWYKQTATPANFDRVFQTIDGDFVSSVSLIYNNSTTMGIYYDSGVGAGWDYSGSFAYPGAGWHHYALTRSGTTQRVFVDGVQVNSTTIATLSDTSAETWVLGGQSVGATRSVTGYFDDFRATNTVARYTSAFGVPFSPFADAGPAEAAFIDLAAGEFTLVGGDQVTSRSYVMPLAAGDMDLIGGVLDFSLATTLVLEAGSLSLNGGNLQFSFGIESVIVFPNKEGADEVDITQLEDGELAINITHGKMYARDSRFNLFTVGGLYNAADLPRSDPGVSGAFWNDDGVLKVSA